MIEDLVKRVIFRLFPELKSKLHLPQWGKIIQVYAVEKPEDSTQLEPLYCVDIKLLDSTGREKDNFPTYEKISLPATGAGNQRGIYAYPNVGSLVELGFILGEQDKPFVKTVLIQHRTIPALSVNDVLISQDENNYLRVAGDGNITEQCQAVAQRIAKLKQHCVVKDGGTVWLGSESENVLNLLSEVSQQLINVSNALANHQHPEVRTGSGSTQAPNNASAYSSASSSTSNIKSRLDTITSSSINEQ